MHIRANKFTKNYFEKKRERKKEKEDLSQELQMILLCVKQIWDKKASKLLYFFKA